MFELCRHIKPEGTACKGPAVRGSQFCRHHQLIKTTLDKVKPTRKNFGIYTPLPFQFPEDRAAIQTNLFLVLHAFNDRKIDAKAANFMTYNLQVCLSNLSKGGPLAPSDTETAIRRVILTPEGDEIATPHEKLEKGESPMHYQDCPCQGCAEQYRGAPPEQHHADCKCGLCEETSDQRSAVSDQAETSDQGSAISDQAEAQHSTNGCHPERSATIGERAVEGSAVSQPATTAPQFAQHEGNHEGAKRGCLDGQSRAASAQRLRSADQLDPIQKVPNYHDYIYGDEIAKHEAQHAARARAALEAGLEPPEHKPWDISTYERPSARDYREWREGIDQRRKESIDKWNAEHPDQPKEFKPFLTWGEEQDLKLAEMKRLREQDEARLREQSLPAS